MPVIKTLPLAVLSSITVASNATSAHYGINVSDYIACGLAFRYTINSAAIGTVYLKIYGCNDANYSTNEKYNILSLSYNPQQLTNDYISIRLMEYRHLTLQMVNATNAAFVANAEMIGVRLS